MHLVVLFLHHSAYSLLALSCQDITLHIYSVFHRFVQLGNNQISSRICKGKTPKQYIELSVGFDFETRKIDILNLL